MSGHTCRALPRLRVFQVRRATTTTGDMSWRHVPEGDAWKQARLAMLAERHGIIALGAEQEE